MDFQLHEPIWLLLLIPLALYAGWQWLKKRTSWTGVLKMAAVMRSITIMLCVLALSAPYILVQNDEEHIIFLVDRSASIASLEHEVEQQLAVAVDTQQAYQQTTVYSFAQTLQTDQRLQAGEALQPLAMIENREGTNIEQALRFAVAAQPENQAARIVLVSDGLETTGIAQQAMSTLQMSDMQLDVYPLTRQIQQDVALQQLMMPQYAVVGEQLKTTVNIYASQDQQITLQFIENDTEIATQQVDVVAGYNEFSYELMAQQQGLVRYTARVVAEQDTVLNNNELVSVTEVGDTPQILVVEHEQTSSLSTLLQQSGVIVKTLAASALPQQLASYLQYDAIIFDNVPGYVVGEQKMALIQQAIEKFAVGFAMIGGERSFGLGGYYDTPIEDIIPVDLDVTGDHQLPSIALMLVLDRSGSMMDGKLVLAKEAAARSVELLRDEDAFGFIAFDDRPWDIIPLSPLADKQQAMDKILSIGVGGGTEIYSSLALAYSQLALDDAQRKHIILLTDGQAATNNSYDALMAQEEHEGITLSTVAIGADADRRLLEQLSELGKGRFYDVVDADTIPSILSRETVMMTRTYIEDTPFIPTVYQSAWNEVFAQGVPQMNAYIATSLKPTAQLVVESDKEDPILATGTAGLGKTLAFTSDSSGAWAGDWAASNFWPQFWQRNIAELLPSYQTAPYTITRNQDGSFTLIDPSNEAAFLEVTAVADNGEEQPLMTTLQAPNELRMTTDAQPGLLFFSVRSRDNELVRIGVTIPYSEEYKVAPTNEALLTQLATAGNGEVLADVTQAFREIDDVSAEETSLQLFFVIVATVLFFLDIALRRFGLPKRRLRKEQAEQQEASNIEVLVKQLKR